MQAKAVSYLPENPKEKTIYFDKSIEKFYIYKKDNGFVEILSEEDLRHYEVLDNYKNIKWRDYMNPRIANYHIVAYKVDLPRTACVGHIYYCAQTDEVYAGKGMSNPLELLSPKKSIFRKCIDWIKAKFREWGAK